MDPFSHQVDIPLSVIGGYLGAGKTTLLNHLLRNSEGRRYAVLVNDFGSINIDAALIESQDDSVIKLDNGCVCCSLVNGLAETLHRIRQMEPWPEHVIVEASGVADPVRISHHAYVAPYRPEAVLVVADAETLRQKGGDRFVGDSVLRQLRGADLVVLNKTDLMSAEQLQEVRQWLQEKAPGGRVVETEYGRISSSLLHGHEARPNLEGDGSHADYASWSVRWPEALEEATFRTAVEGWPETVLRAKGFVFLKTDAERRYLFQKVGRRWTLEPDQPWAALPQTELVLIGLKGQLEGAELLAALKAPAVSSTTALHREV